jgi:hypothetical protein
VCLKALVKIGGDAYITLDGDGKAFEKIYIFMIGPPCPLRLRRPGAKALGTPFALERCSALS